MRKRISNSNGNLCRTPYPPVSRERRGKVLVLFAIMLPVMIGMIGLVVDTSMMMVRYRNLQGIADMAATAASTDLLRGESVSTATSTASWHVNRNHLTNYTLDVNIPPSQGAYDGNPNFVEVILSQPVQTYFIHLLGASTSNTVRATSVAGHEPTTAGAAVVVLEPEPPAYTIAAGSPWYSDLPASSAGLEFRGSNHVYIDGAIHVNTEWGGVDEDGVTAGNGSAPPHAVSCPTSHIHTLDVRVAGGVDDPNNYRAYTTNDLGVLKANRYPVPDPLESIPVPTTSTDSNVKADYYGGVETPQLETGQTNLSPGVYDWIDVPYGRVHFLHGIYIIRGVNPDTGIALNVKGDYVDGEEVMFYITDSPDYDATTGLPDADDGDAAPPEVSSTTLMPSVVIDVGGSSRFTHLNDLGRGAGPYADMLIFQRRMDRRPIIFRRNVDASSAYIRGNIYSKWGHLIFADKATNNMRLVAGSMRIINLGSCRIDPPTLLPPAEDVFVVQ